MKSFVFHIFEILMPLITEAMFNHIYLRLLFL